MVQKRKNNFKNSKKNLSLGISLYKSLFSSNFLIMESGLHNKKLFIYGVFIFKKRALYILESKQTLISLKQFIINIRFLNNKRASTIKIMVSNKQYYHLLKLYLKRYPHLKNSLTVQNFCFLQVPNHACKLEMGLLLEDSISFYDNKPTKLYNLLLGNLFFITEVNPTKNNNKACTYKIYNDLRDFRKIVFLLTIINTFKTYNLIQIKNASKK